MPRESLEIPAETIPAGKLKSGVYRLPKVFSTAYFIVFGVNLVREWLITHTAVFLSLAPSGNDTRPRAGRRLSESRQIVMI